MKKQCIIVGMAVLILTVGLSGCTSTNSDTGNPPPTTTTYTSKLVYLHSDSKAKITEACVEVQNTGDSGAWFVVDFEFVKYDEENLGQGNFTGGDTGYDGDETFHMEKQVYVAAHKSNTVKCVPHSWEPAISLRNYNVYLD
jgi:uncharacterized protein YceK